MVCLPRAQVLVLGEPFTSDWFGSGILFLVVFLADLTTYFAVLSPLTHADTFLSCARYSIMFTSRLRLH